MNIDEWRSQIKRGTLEFCVLLMIARGECYGYELISRLEKRPILAAKESTIYPLLRRLLREGLALCGAAKEMVEYLLDSTQALKSPSEELSALADQIRAVLGRFSPDDPAVAALKQSEAYQKVAYLIEGLEPPVAGRQLQ